MKKILIAETLRNVISDNEGILARDDIVMSYAPSAGEILSSHRADKADLIIVDLEMPELGEMCSVIRKEEGLRAVSIIVACDSGTEKKEISDAFGANAVISIPAESKYMLSRIRELLDISERKSVREIVKVSVTVNSEGSFFFAVAKNLSLSGLLVETGRVIPRGSIVSCSFVLQYQVIAEGEIVRVSRTQGKSGDNFEYGIRFTGLSPAAKSEIEGYIRDLRAEYPGTG